MKDDRPGSNPDERKRNTAHAVIRTSLFAHAATLAGTATVNAQDAPGLMARAKSYSPYPAQKFPNASTSA